MLTRCLSASHISVYLDALPTFPPFSQNQAADAAPTCAARTGLTAALGEVFKQGQRGLLLKQVPAAWAIAQKLLASPAAQGSVLARCMALWWIAWLSWTVEPCSMLLVGCN